MCPSVTVPSGEPRGNGPKRTKIAERDYCYYQGETTEDENSFEYKKNETRLH